MRRLILSIALSVAGMAFASVSYAGCACQCQNGWMRGVCSSIYEMPPTCAQTPCPFKQMSTTPDLTPPGLRTTSCSDVKQCDVYGHCEWKRVCN
jgi:hypothetical protein